MEVPGGDKLMSPRMRMGILCDHAIVGQDGKLSLIGLFDRLSVPSLPIQHPRFFLVAVIDIAPGTYTVSVEFLDPTGHNVLQGQGFSVPVTVASDNERGNFVAELNMLPLEFSGRYTFVLSVSDLRIGTVVLDVDVARPTLVPNQIPVGQA